MKKPSQNMSNDNSTQRILKPKMLQHQQQHLLQQKKLSINPNNNNINKIMLTDLCPQQKAKIGQLIKTLQQRKSQNQQLTQQLTTYKLNFINLQKQHKQLQQQLTQKIIQIQKLNQQLQQHNKLLIQKDIQIHQFKINLEKYDELAKLKQFKISYGVGTDYVERVNKETQTKEKKGKKYKDRQVQVNTIGGERQRGQQLNIKERKYNNNYTNNNNNNTNIPQPNSRSFEKIMKNQLLSSLSTKKQNQQKKQKLQQQQQQQYGSFNQQQEQLRYAYGGQGYGNDGGDGRQLQQDDEEQEYQEGNCQQSTVKNDNNKSNLNTNKILINPNKNNNNNWSQYSSSCDPTFSQNPQQYHLQPLKSTSTNRNPIEVEDTQNDDDQFQMLARKWMELKQKNIQQLSQGWMMESGRESFGIGENNREGQFAVGGGDGSKDRDRDIVEKRVMNKINNINNKNNNQSQINKSNNLPQQKLLLQMQSKIRTRQQKQFLTNIRQNNQFLTNKSNNYYQTNTRNNPHPIRNNKLIQQRQQQTPSQQIDQLQLNRALKSKDFSASRLLNNSRSKLGSNNNNEKFSSQQSQRKRSLEKSMRGYNNINNGNSNRNNNMSQHRQQQQQQQVLSSIKMISSTQQQQYHNRGRNIQKGLSVSNNNNKNDTKSATFYNSQLLDLVEEINK